MMIAKVSRSVGMVFVVLAMALATTALGAGKDVRGSSDHPLLSRYPGATIFAFRKFDYEEYKLAVGVEPKSRRAQTQVFAGKATSIIYGVKGDQSAVQVFRNYEQAVQKAGMKILFSCLNKDCGQGLPIAVFKGTSREVAYQSMRYGSIHVGSADFGYLSATGTYNGAPVSVGVYVGRIRTEDRTNIGVDIVESQEMKSGLIAVSAESLNNDIEAQGKAVLEGVYFDTNQATIKPESRQALDAIASYLKSNASSSFFVVGHTDTVGSYEHNVDLSRRRAQTVIAELVSAQGITAKRLIAVGVGPVSPVGANKSEAGRAANRRVELVLQEK